MLVVRRASLRYSKKAFAVSVQQPLCPEKCSTRCVFFLTKILCMHHSFYPQKRKQTFSYSHSVTRISILNNVSVGFIIKDRRHQKTCVILVCIFNLNGSFWKKKLDNDILPGFIIESPPKPHRPISITDRHNCERNKSNSVGIKRYPHYKTY